MRYLEEAKKFIASRRIGVGGEPIFVDAVILAAWAEKLPVDLCQFCGKRTLGFDEHGPLCIDCAVVRALKEGM